MCESAATIAVEDPAKPLEGALLINAVGIDDVAQADEMVKLATAVAHLIGRSNFDAMSGQYYARFVAKSS